MNISIHCRNICKLFVRALETGSLFLPCFAASANQFYIYRQCTYIVFILQCLKVKNNCQTAWKRAETIVVLIIFNGDTRVPGVKGKSQWMFYSS